MYRLAVIRRVIQDNGKLVSNVCNGFTTIRSYADKTHITIGDVAKTITPAKKPQFVPHKYLAMGELNQQTLRNLRWMLQKDKLGQDIFLIGRPGPMRRQLAMCFLEITGREIEYISLSRDTTEADLKQRREISSGTAHYFDQSAVRAAIEGRVLVLEGIEKAERNVLPVLNNLLENREMHLEDGRFLIPASRYDKLLKEHSKEELDKWNLVRVSDEFRVIALGLPVPKYIGNPLDPPLRSRFQARDVYPLSFQEQLQELLKLAPNCDQDKLKQLLSCCHGLMSEESAALGLPDFPIDNITTLARLLDNFPQLSVNDVFYRLYPYNTFLKKEGRDSVQHLLNTFRVDVDNTTDGRIEEVKIVDGRDRAEAVVEYAGNEARVQVPSGSLQTDSQDHKHRYIPTNYQEQLLANMLQSHTVSDFCIVGPKGCGKSVTLHKLATMLNYEVEPIVLYQDITSRELIQQRNTLPNGDTVWQESPLINAALDGKLAVLDGLDRVHQSTLAVVHRLVHDREIQLYDGKRLLNHDRYDAIKNKNKLTDEDMIQSGTMRIHPSFRIVGLAETPKPGSTKGNWLTPEMLSLFLYHEMRPLSVEEESHIINKLYGGSNDKISAVSKLASRLRKSEDPTLSSLSSSFSTRQLLRIAKRLSSYPEDSLYETVQKACLARFLPPLAKQALDNILQDEQMVPESTTTEPNSAKCIVDNDYVQIGSTKVPRYVTNAKTKVPDIVFYDVPQHVQVLEWLLQDFNLGEHLLLVGNQGVGKNKLADRLLQLLNRPREYIQLHRDTTVQTLTLQPTVRDGVVTYEDSPLVQAAKNGHVLVIDEADKAPTHVTCILKTLVESGEMTLSDGRRIVPNNDPRLKSGKSNLIPLHPDFRTIVLANRPGFPFLGNDFFASLGDLFSCHAVDNPSPESEIALLKNYGPDVPEHVITKLVKAFGELRTMADKGLVQYPYSTREVVNIVRHIQEFPDESLSSVVRNVFDFDRYSATVLNTLVTVLQKHGIPINANVRNINLAQELPLPKLIKSAHWEVHRPEQLNDKAVEVRNIKYNQNKSLPISATKMDKTEARSVFFSEMNSYWSIPLNETSSAIGLAVTKGDEDLIHVLSMNPLKLHTVLGNTEKISSLSLEGFVPRPRYGTVFKFTVSPLAEPYQGCVLLHEQNTNFLAVVNTLDRKLKEIDVTSTSEKIANTLRITQNASFQINSQLHGQNQFILQQVRGGRIDLLDLNVNQCYTLELPVRVQSLVVASVDKWILHDVNNRKYVLEKKSAGDPVPMLLYPLNEENLTENSMGLVTSCNLTNLDETTLSTILGEKLTAPSRVLTSSNCFATVSVGFPELDRSKNELYSWCRPPNDNPHREPHRGRPVFLQNSSQVVCSISPESAPSIVRTRYHSEGENTNLAGYLEVVDLKQHKLRYIPVPLGNGAIPWYLQGPDSGLCLEEMSKEGLVTVDKTGCIRLWETGLLQLERSLDEWKKLVGSDKDHIQLTIQKDSGKDVSSPKHGKVDPKNKPHVGGNTWAGGTGGRDTAGLGGKGGPYRLDAGHDVTQISDAEKDDVPEEVKKAAREMGRRAFQQRLKEIQMSEYDHGVYTQFSDAVQKQVQALRVIIESVQAKSKERQWTRHQTTGDFDDMKLIEGLTGEKTIYRRRAEKEPELGTPQTKPKRLKLVVDVSGSMYRFNSYDSRLDRMLEATVLVMEAFQGNETKFRYDIVGHSGDAYDLVFCEAAKPPANNKQRLDIIKTMHAHSQFCMSGDHTLAATIDAINKISAEDCDEAIVVVLSDANLERYGIRPERFATALTANPDVNAYAIFIGSLGDQAQRLIKQLPAGRAFVCMDLTDIPRILQQIFTTSMLSSA